jgi:hypothetical protein
LGWIIFGLALC